MIYILWLTSPSRIISRSIHVAANGIIVFFLWLSGIPFVHSICIYVPRLLYLLICQWTSRLLLCLSYCSAAMNTGVHGSFQIRVFTCALFYNRKLIPFDSPLSILPTLHPLRFTLGGSDSNFKRGILFVSCWSLEGELEALSIKTHFLTILGAASSQL